MTMTDRRLYAPIYRVVRNNSRVGRPWLVVHGYYAAIPRMRDDAPARRWYTDVRVSDHDTRAQAEADMADRAARRARLARTTPTGEAA
jgi:hypothetical protein